MSANRGPELLTKEHDVSAFDCGSEPLNTFLRRFALINQSNDSARTFVILAAEQRVVGYYSLAAAGLAHDEAPRRVIKGLAAYPVPAILMARLAVDSKYQGMGLGAALFKDALRRTLSVSKDVAARAFIVHAKDAEAKAFYERFRTEPFPENPFHLYLLMKDAERALGR